MIVAIFSSIKSAFFKAFIHESTNDDYTLGALGALVGLASGRSIIAALAVTLSGVRQFCFKLQRVFYILLKVFKVF